MEGEITLSENESNQVTLILGRIQSGDELATERLLPRVYEELRAMARAQMANEPAGHTLQPTALVHEAYMRLIGGEDISWENRGHFFGAAAEAMRRILIDRARRVRREKHGGNRQRVELPDTPGADGSSGEDLLAIDEALTRLERVDARMSDIVKLRYFAGLTIEETAGALGVTSRTVNRDWRAAKAWLAAELTGDAPPSERSHP